MKVLLTKEEYKNLNYPDLNSKITLLRVGERFTGIISGIQFCLKGIKIDLYKVKKIK